MKTVKEFFQNNLNVERVVQILRDVFKQRRKPPIFATSTISTIEVKPLKIKSLRKGTNDDFLYNGSFHEAAGPILALAQFFAIMPVKGVKSKSSNALQFKWKSCRTIYSSIIFSLISLNAICAVFWLFHDNITFIRIVPVVFYVSNAYAMVCFARLASKWPVLMKSWQDVERDLPPIRTQFGKRRLAQQIKMISTTVLVISLSEHLLSIITELTKHTTCRTIEDPLKRIIVHQLPHIFLYTTYNVPKALLAKTINILATFVWSYTDLFLMIISVGLSSCFKQINDSLMLSKEKVMPESFWTEHRRAYRNLCALCELVDNDISKITLISFSNNLYFICVQLLWSLKLSFVLNITLVFALFVFNPMPTMVHAVYFWFSFIYLISRTLAVTLYSAEINEQSKQPFKVIRVVPRESWCLEIKRFSNEVTRDIVALSGMKFFYLTKRLVLRVAATIVTYELVLIQFHEDSTVYEINQC